MRRAIQTVRSEVRLLHAANFIILIRINAVAFRSSQKQLIFFDDYFGRWIKLIR
jgi:hypothetical protein